jgi:hypothetical protein
MISLGIPMNIYIYIWSHVFEWVPIRFNVH